jgi:hypothetical protein
MADHCGICDTRRPKNGTRLLVLNNGEFWIEFCEDCQDETLTNGVTGEEVTLDALFKSVFGTETAS